MMKYPCKLKGFEVKSNRKNRTTENQENTTSKPFQKNINDPYTPGFVESLPQPARFESTPKLAAS